MFFDYSQTYLVVRNAGHMVPISQPLWARRIAKEFTRRRPKGDGDKEVNKYVVFWELKLLFEKSGLEVEVEEAAADQRKGVLGSEGLQVKKVKKIILLENQVT